MSRLPRWLLYAILPTVLAGGFVAGVAYKTYHSKPAAVNVAKGASQPDAPPATQPNSAPAPAAGIKPAPPVTTPGAIGAAGTGTSPRPSAGPPVSSSVATALSILRSDYMSFSVNGQALSVDDYHVLPGTVMNKNTISAWIRVDQYPAWETAMRTRPADVEAWMDRAAAAVKPYAADFAFELSWAVVDTVTDQPRGFYSYEVSRKGDGRYLVIRPLAATAFLYSKFDPGHVTLRPFDAYGQLPQYGVWAMYSPTFAMLSGSVSVPPSTGKTGKIVWAYKAPGSAPDQIRTAAATLYKYARTFVVGGLTLSVSQYQPLPLATRTVVGGLISLSDYPAWQAALDQSPDLVRQWIAQAVDQIRPGTSSDSFYVVWTVVDVVKERPNGFTTEELTPLDGAWLVTRPVAIADVGPTSAWTFSNVRSQGDTAYKLSDFAFNTYRPAIYFDAKSQYVVPAK